MIIYASHAVELLKLTWCLSSKRISSKSNVVETMRKAAEPRPQACLALTMSLGKTSVYPAREEHVLKPWGGG